MARWGKSDDEKLAELWRTGRNGINPEDLSIEAVKNIHRTHFSQFKYENFAPLYRDKARSWNVNRTLEGHRKSEYHTTVLACRLVCEYLTANCSIIGSKLAKEAFAGKATEKKPAKKSSTPLGEEDTTSGEEEENKEEEGVEEAEDEDSVEDEDEEEMSSRKTKSMTPPRPKKPTKEKSSLSPDGVEKLVRGVNKLLVASSYSLDASFPHIMYSYERDGIIYTSHCGYVCATTSHVII